MAFKKKIKTTRIDTLVGRHSKIVGDIRYSGGLHIEGTVEGNIMAEHEDKGVVIVSELGVVEGEIRGPSIIINGTVHGDVYATGTIELAAGAEVNGNLVHQQTSNTAQAE